MATRFKPGLIKAGFVVSSLVICALGFQAAQQPGGNPDIQVMAIAFGIYQLLAELVVLPLVMRSLTKKRPYNPADMLIKLAFHENGVLLGFVLSFISHDPRYLYFFSFPCILLLVFTPTGER